MDIRITPKSLNGSVEIISSKTYAHRILIAAALSDKPTEIYVNTMSEDIMATTECINSMGAKAVYDEKNKLITVTPITAIDTAVVLNARESGSTARFILPVAAALFDSVSLNGYGRLPKRPLKPLLREMAKNGVKASSDFIPLKTEGRLKSGVFEIEGNISSQYITGLLMALPLLDGDSEIRLTTPLESRSYVDITVDVLKTFGINIEKTPSGYIVKSGKYISPSRIVTEGDWSNAAFWIVANEISGGVTVGGLSAESLQGDRKITELLKETEIDAGDIPDLVPVLSVLALSRNKVTRIYNAGRLRLKESDRIETTAAMVRALGGKVEVGQDYLKVFGKGYLDGGEVDGAGDHRIVMSAAVASLICKSEVKIKGCEAVNKSYPEFFDALDSIRVR